MRKTSDDRRISVEERGPKVKGLRLTRKEAKKQASHYLERDRLIPLFDWRDNCAVAKNIFL